jgi:hypothetical protein
VDDGGIVEGLTDSHIVVKGHHCQEDALSGPQRQENEELDRTVQETDSFLGNPEVDKHLRDTTCSEAEVQEGEVGEEKVHWGVESGVQHREQDDECFAHQGQEVGNQDNHKENLFQLWMFREAQKDEAHWGALVGHGLFLSSWKDEAARLVCSNLFCKNSHECFYQGIVNRLDFSAFVLPGFLS